MKKNISRRQDFGTLKSGGGDSAINLQTSIYEAIVTDVILDFTHPKYTLDNDAPASNSTSFSNYINSIKQKKTYELGYNVGTVQVRILDERDTIDTKLLEWAHPIDSTISEYPLIGELVILHKIMGIFFYKTKIPLVRQLQENAMLNLNKSLDNKYANTISNSIKNEDELPLESHRFGNYFRPDNRVRQLKHFEGDTLIQGRMGNSIRFGNSKMDPSGKGLAPNLILRAGQGKDLEENIPGKSPFGIILEDINADASSIWLVSDQHVPFEPATTDNGSFNRSRIKTFEPPAGASIIINSDKIILNAKKTDIMLFSNEEIYLSSFNRTSIDTDGSIMLTANIDIINRTSRNMDFMADGDYSIFSGGEYRSVVSKTTSFLSTKIFIGSASDNREPMVGGTSLSIFLGRLIAALMGIPPAIGVQTQANPRIRLTPLSRGPASTAHVITPAGPGLLNPIIQRALEVLYKELEQGTFTKSPFNSQDNFVNLVNEKVEIELNEFKTGRQIEIENYEWTLGKPYYDIIVE
jgi:hypothetical protein